MTLVLDLLLGSAGPNGTAVKRDIMTERSSAFYTKAETETDGISSTVTSTATSSSLPSPPSAAAPTPPLPPSATASASTGVVGICRDHNPVSVTSV